MVSDIKSIFLSAALGNTKKASINAAPSTSSGTAISNVDDSSALVSGARFGNITIFPDDPAPPDLNTAAQAPFAHDGAVSVPDSVSADNAATTLPKPMRRRGEGAKSWRPNPSFPMDDYEGMVESAAQHSMSVGSFIVALCQAYIYGSPFILKQHLRPSMPPMTAEQYRSFSGMANNLNQIARVMNEGRKTAITHGTDYPEPPKELNALLQAIYILLRVA